MRNRSFWWTGVLLVGLLAAGPGQGQGGVNLKINGGFEDGVIAPLAGYGGLTATVVTECTGADVPEDPIEGTYCLHVVVPSAGANSWDIYLVDPSYTFEKGKKYTFAAFMKCKSGTLEVRLKPELQADPWTGYNESVVTITDEWAEYWTTTDTFSANVSPASTTVHVGFAAGDLWIDGIRLFEGVYVAPDFIKNYTATDPSPADGDEDVVRDVVLSWTAGPVAATHDVYFGTTFDDANDADTNAPLGAQVSAGQSETTFDPEGLLEFGRVYYWRVDEVNAAPDFTVYKGAVWSFTAEPFTYPIERIAATASSSEKTANGPDNTIDGSGLDGDLHGTLSTDMWLSSMTGEQPTWIRYKFDRAYKLDEMWVWNYNVEFEGTLGYGFKDVTVEYSLDGTTWELLGDVEFAQAQAAAQSEYAHNTTVDFGGVMAQYVRLTANSNWSLLGLKQYGLSEVRFYYEPVVARDPSPEEDAEGVSLAPTLNWRPGREAVSHTVYFGDDEQAVTNGTAPAASVTEPSYQVDGLQYGTVYYWRVDEVNDAATDPVRVGDVWSFTTIDHFDVDTFEDYDDDENRVFDTWTDGYTTKDNGSTVGYLKAPFCEQTIVHGGGQSMPFAYDNTGAAYSSYYSEAYREFSPTWDWTADGATDLVMYVRGYPPVGEVAVGETGGQMSLTGAGLDIEEYSDEFTFAYKTLPGDGSLIARVVSNGTGSNTWAKGGVMIRDSLNGGSAHAMMVMTGGGGNGAAFQYRAETDGDTTNVDVASLITPPYWVKITKEADMITSYVSSDGKNWNGLTSVSIVMTSPIYIGLAVTSHDPGVNRTFEFDNIAATGAAGSWQGAVISSPIHNTPQNFFVMLQDSSNQSAVVNNADVVTGGDWTEVKIPLSDFAGVNPAKVKRLYVGVGDRENPVPGDASLIYIDDIQVGRVVEQVYENLLDNGGFESGALDLWGVFGNATMKVVQTGPVEGSYCAEVTVPSKPANFWDCGIKNTGHTLQAGKTYTLSAFCKCDQGTRQINFKPEQDGGSYTGYGEHTFTMTTEWAEYTTTTPEMTSTVTPVSITFHVGYAAGTFWMDCVRFYEGEYVAPDL